MKYFIETFGCAMNEADSESIAAGLEKQGYSCAKKIEDAALIIINTCSVRQKAEDKVYGLANKINELKIGNSEGIESKAPNCKLKIVVTGCMVGGAVGERRRTKLTELMRRMPWVDDFVLLEDLDKAQKQRAEEPALVAVMRGCDQFCSYCAVPYGRGAAKSRPMEEIVEEVECLVDRGVKWVTLLGQSINDYYSQSELQGAPSEVEGGRHKSQNSFVELLKRVHEVGGLEKISLLSFNPWNFSDEVVETLALPKFERYIHLPVQSGDDEILKKMNRPYTVAEYKNLVKKIREKISGIRIGTDAIVGFPGETEEQFQNTVKLFKELKFENAFIFLYSPRPGTAAAKVYKDNISLSEKKRRHRILMQAWRGSCYDDT